MVNPQGTSFIPKNPTKGKVQTVGIRKIYLLSYLSYIFFFCTLIVTAGIFAYGFSINTQLEAQKQQLALEREAFDQSDIERVRELDFRINAAVERMDNHVAVSSVLQGLEEIIPQPVQFQSFSYNRLAGGIPRVSVTGYTEDFNALLFQRQVLASDDLMGQALLSNVNLITSAATVQSEGNPTGENDRVISFTLTADLDQLLIRYTGLTNTDTAEQSVEDPSFTAEENGENQDGQVTQDGEQQNESPAEGVGQTEPANEGDGSTDVAAEPVVEDNSESQ